MRACGLIEYLNRDKPVHPDTCDTVKAGDPERELKKVAVTMFATVEVVRRAKAWGADMLITHEPTYYEHMEKERPWPVVGMKHKLVEEGGMVLYRYHDRPHTLWPDLIAEGETHYMGLSGKLEKTPYSASCLYTLDTPMTALELARHIEKTLGIAHLRICGERNKPVTVIGTCFGTPGGVMEHLASEDVQVVLVGEACEWIAAEYARDAAAFGLNKTLIIMGHCGSERDGMRLLAERLEAAFDFECRYLECGEVYTYTDT